MKRVLPTIFFFSVAFGCNKTGKDTDQGTIVGNPGDSMVRVAPTSDVDLVEAFALIDGIELVPCEGEMVSVDLDEEFDLLAPEVIELPTGAWCELNVIWGDSLYFDGDGADNNSFELDLSVDETLTEGDIEITSDETYIIEIGHPDWLSVASLGLQADEQLYIGDGDPQHDELADDVVSTSGVFHDPNADGQIDDEERDQGPLAAGDARDDQPPPREDSTDTDAGTDTGTGRIVAEGVGCKGGSTSWLFLLPLFPLFGFRREESPNGPRSSRIRGPKPGAPRHG